MPMSLRCTAPSFSIPHRILLPVPLMPITAPLALGEILRQPGSLRELLGRRDEMDALLRTAAGGGGFERFNAFGCGDGFFAAEAATRAFVDAGLTGYRGVSALDFLETHAAAVDAATLLLPISMSGNVDRTVEGLSVGQKRGGVGLAITNSQSGLLAQSARFSFNLSIVEPKGFMAGTVTYTSSVVALSMIAALLSPGYSLALDPAIRQLEDIDASLGDLRERVAAIVGELPAGGRIFFLAGGSGAASARYAAAKFVELTATHAIAQDTEEFAHANFWQFQPADLAFVLHEPAEPADISAKTAAMLREFGARVIEILPGDPARQEADRIAIVNRHPTWSALALSFPLQLIAYHWALKDGLDPDTRNHLRGDEFRFRLSRRLSRKTLVGQS